MESLDGVDINSFNVILDKKEDGQEEEKKGGYTFKCMLLTVFFVSVAAGVFVYLKLYAPFFLK